MASMKFAIALTFIASSVCHGGDSDTGDVPTTVAPLSIKATSATVYVAFGADSTVTADTWSFCNGSGLNCTFDLKGTQDLPLNGDYINATFAFNHAVGCGATKAEVNMNKSDWYDVLDVSLVDGYSNKVQITVTPDGGTAEQLGPPVGQDGNEAIEGVFPYGCDICTARQSPPCGIPTGGTGCKAGTQYDPKPPCQYQGKTMGGGGSTVLVELID